MESGPGVSEGSACNGRVRAWTEKAVPKLPTLMFILGYRDAYVGLVEGRNDQAAPWTLDPPVMSMGFVPAAERCFG